MAITRKQWKHGNGSDPGSATFDATPVQGNLLVAIAMDRSGGSLASGTAVISGSGWTQQIGRDTLLADGDDRRSFCLFWKVAGASEPTTITIDNGTANNKAILLQEFESSTGQTYGFSEKADNDNGTTNSALSIATGTTASTSGDQLIVPVFIARIGDVNNSINGNVSFASGTSPVNTTDGINGRHITTAFFESSVTGTKSDTATIDLASDANTGLSAGIAVFSLTTSTTRQQTLCVLNAGV